MSNTEDASEEIHLSNTQITSRKPINKVSLLKFATYGKQKLLNKKDLVNTRERERDREQIRHELVIEMHSYVVGQRQREIVSTVTADVVGTM